MISPRTLRNLKREFRSSLLAKIGLVLVIAVILVAVFAPFIAPHNPYNQNLDDSKLPPLGFSKQTTQTSSKMVDGQVKIVNNTSYVKAQPSHPLGTDQLGRDILSRVIYGARTSLLVGIFGTLLAMLIGVTVGLVAGYYGELVDDALMRSADIMLAFPSLVLAIALVGMFDQQVIRVPDPFVASGLVSGMPAKIGVSATVVVVVALVNWVWFARVSRGEALTVVGEEYVKAARSVGAKHSFVLRKHILPNSVTPIIVLATIQIAAIILLESSLSYLGFSGVNLSWGFDISQGKDYLATSWWISTVPGLAIVITVIGINLVGDWLRDALDPGIDGEGGGV
ncbi:MULTISPECIES: ABC transporter permease [unclassified Haladaptatus]|uniref:ABC transporter permease n=1 Tax=unclassified Haladaptatus TaxID=2622732 RepID=UPI00209BC151|nr:MULTISPECIES: ABC transporter permease [unclassified Haladaptatus]MCO8245140.1 ABC transporter permease [Haladaptatus sp. AB643]MCO8253283.1 ABC transporter permease [Haladaptatus sp. AB618]